MPGSTIALFTDENVHARLARTLRERGSDATSCQEAGRSNQRIPDDEQLAYAAEQGRAILTFNSVDYVPLDLVWKATGRHHAGIIVAPEITDFGILLRRVERHLIRYQPHEQSDVLLWLAP